jgi:gas vesicle protein
MSLGKIIIGTLAGLGAGLAIGILTAPASGEETRAKITDSAEEVKRKLRRFKNNGVQELEELANIVKNEAQGIQEDLRRRILDLIERAKSGASNLNRESNPN